MTSDKCCRCCRAGHTAAAIVTCSRVLLLVMKLTSWGSMCAFPHHASLACHVKQGEEIRPGAFRTPFHTAKHQKHVPWLFCTRNEQGQRVVPAQPPRMCDRACRGGSPSQCCPTWCWLSLPSAGPEGHCGTPRRPAPAGPPSETMRRSISRAAAATGSGAGSARAAPAGGTWHFIFDRCAAPTTSLLPPPSHAVPAAVPAAGSSHWSCAG
jgi:hypothetical protein